MQSKDEYNNLKDERNYIQLNEEETKNESKVITDTIHEDVIKRNKGNVDELAVTTSDIGGTKDGPIENIDVLTQHSKESHNNDNHDDSWSSGYVEYEKQIEKLSAHQLPY